MKDLISKLTKLEATAPKPKKMLTEDSTSPMIVEPKTRSLKDVFNELSESIAPGTKPLAIMDPAKKQAGMGVLSSPNPGVQNILKNLYLQAYFIQCQIEKNGKSKKYELVKK